MTIPEVEGVSMEEDHSTEEEHPLSEVNHVAINSNTSLLTEEVGMVAAPGQIEQVQTGRKPSWRILVMHSLVTLHMNGMHTLVMTKVTTK